MGSNSKRVITIVLILTESLNKLLKYSRFASAVKGHKADGIQISQRRHLEDVRKLLELSPSLRCVLLIQLHIDKQKGSQTPKLMPGLLCI